MITKNDLTQEQQYAVNEVVKKIDSGQQCVTLGGFAGTGKTTIVPFIIDECRALGLKSVAYCAYTGKASAVLRSKIQDAFTYLDSCSTIHSLIYIPIVVMGKVTGYELRDDIEYQLILIDEASMVTEAIYNDLVSFGKPIIAIGDHGQLPPIGCDFSLMKNPEIKLEKVMRQAEENPIIKLSMMARIDGYIPYGEYAPGVIKTDNARYLLENIPHINDLILCGMNRTRTYINERIRKLYQFNEEKPQVGDKLICLKNNQEAGIHNGMFGFLTAIEDFGKHWYEVSIAVNNDFVFNGRCCKYQFGQQKRLLEFPSPHKNVDQRLLGDLFDYAYCITVHKAQGSESDTVFLIEERMPYMTDDNWKRWLYTAVTRAKKKLYIIKKR